MAWTSPMTFVDGTALAAAQLNTHLRDNLAEQSAAKALTAGSYFAVDGKNQVSPRIMSTASVLTAETTTTQTYDDLTTPGPVVTAVTGISALALWGCTHQGSSSGGMMSLAVSGATTQDPSDIDYNRQSNTTAGTSTRLATAFLFTGLTPGSNTFTAKYKATQSETFSNRTLIVWPM